MTVGDALWQIFQVILGLGVIALFVVLALFATRILLRLLLVLFSIGVVLALYYDAISGWPILRRVAWLIMQIFWTIYNAMNIATQDIPQL